MQYRVEEGMNVYDYDGQKVGEVHEVIVGGESKEARLFVIEKGLVFKHDYLVPREAIERVTTQGVHLSLPKDRIQEMPEYEGRPPTREQAHRAYSLLGGRGTIDRIEFDRLPFQPATPERAERGRGAGAEPSRTEEGRGRPYVVTVEEYLVLSPKERADLGYRDEWDYSGGGLSGNR